MRDGALIIDPWGGLREMTYDEAAGIVTASPSVGGRHRARLDPAMAGLEPVTAGLLGI